jgi:gliding motility-associated-like protein
MKRIFLLFSRYQNARKNLVFLLVFFMSIFFSTETFASHAAGMDITYKFVGYGAGTNTGREVTVTVNTDLYPEEMFWTIEDAVGNVFFEITSNTYTQSCHTYTHTVCLPFDVPLQFNWGDTWGDGWNSGPCPGFDQGQFYILQGSNIRGQGDPVWWSGNWGSSGTVNFTVLNSITPTCTYTATVENLSYEITLSFYYDCANSTSTLFPTEIRWEEWANTNGGGYNSTPLTQQGSPTNVTPVCDNIADPCNNVTFAYQKYTYTCIITLPNRDEWKIWTEPVSARNQTTYGPAFNWPTIFDDLCVVANIDNTIHLSSSPVFSSDPISFLCNGGDCFYNGATDPELDNLTYTLTPPKTDEGLNDNMNYQNGTYLLPFPNGTTTCDPLTGDLCVNTTSIGTSVAAIKVTESRNGTNIGFVTRDIQLWTRNCIAVSPPSSIVTSGPNTTFNSINNSFSFCVDGSNQLSFDLQATSTVNIEMLNSVLPSGATFTTNPATPLSFTTVTGTFSWTPTAADIAGSPYVININVSDDDCPLPNSTSETYIIYLNGFDVTENFTPLTTCTPSNGTASVTPNGSSSYTYAWNTSPAQTTATATGLIAGTYICTITDNTTGCITDSPPVIVTSTVTLPTVTAISSNTTICEGNPVTLNGSGTSGVTYSWNNGATNGTPINPNTTTTYTVTGIDGAGCLSSDMITVTVNPLPTVTASSTPISPLCEGDDLTLNGSGATTYIWDNSVTDNTLFTQANGTITYTVIGTDANSCENTATISVTVNALPAVTASSSPVSPLCEGDDLTLNGGGAATYSWDNSVIDNTLFTQANGTITYTVTGTDANSCENTATISVTVNPLPTVTASSNPTSPLCEGDYLTLNGGGATTYTWDNGVIDNTSFIPGNGTVLYTVTGTDANSCENTATISATVNPSPTVTANSNPITPLCEGDDLTLNGSGATTYTWDNSVINNTLFTPAVGTITYTVTGTDANSCENTATISITVNPLPTVTATSIYVAPLCEGDNLTLNGAGATSYTWDNGVTDNTSFTPSAGTVLYSVTGTDANSCENTATISVTVNALPAVTATSTPLSPLCEGNNLTLNGAGATTYTWDNGVIDNTSFTPGNGTVLYTVTGTDANSCENTATISVTVNALPAVTATSSPPSPLCEGDNLTLNGAGATTYTWDNGVIDNTSFTPGNGTVLYTVTGTDANTCVNTATISITINNSTTSIDTQIACASYTWLDGVTYTSPNNSATWTTTNTVGCNNVATLDLTFSSVTTSTDNVGTHCDTYTWINGITYTASNNTATWTTTDVAGCTNIATLDLTINYSTTSTDSQIHCDTYTWLDGITYTSSNNTAIYTSTNAAGCDNVATLNLTINNSTSSTDSVGTHCDSYTWLDGVTYTTSNNSATFTSVNTAGCDNVATLDLTINNSTSSSFSISECDSYFWEGISYNLSGTYMRTLNTINGCDSIVTLSLTIISGTFEITTNINITDVDCFGMNNGAINLYPSGGISPLTFSWDNAATTQNINSLPPGNYSFTITDSIGCTLDSTVSVSEPDKLIASFQANNEICRNDSISILIELTNPTYNYYTVQFYDSIQKSFIIDSSGVLIPEGIPFYIIPNLSNQIQLISVTDNNGCTSDINQSLDIIVNEFPILEINQDDICVGTPSFILNEATPNGGNYFINDVNTDFFDVENLENGAYTIRYEYTDIINNCSNSIEKIININPNPIADFSFSPQPADIENPTILFVNESENIINTKWILGDGTTLTDELEFWHTYADTGTYNVTYAVRNQFNCSDTAKATLIINPVYQIFIPSAFTPNNDGDNDNFKIEIIGQKEYLMTIFNRWGEIIFEEKNGAWDGKLNNNIVQNGTYSYTILVSDFKDKPFIYKGIVTLIK